MLRLKERARFALVGLIVLGACGDEEKTRDATDTQTGGVTGSVDGGAPGVPCDVAAVVAKSCTTCHGEPLVSAPYPLTQHAHFQGLALDKTRPVHQAALARINATDNTVMPPPGYPPLSEAEKKTLSDWLAAGAPASAASCAGAPVTSADAGTGSSTGKGAKIAPIDYQDPNITCHKFTAFTQGDRNQPYQVPTTPDLYVNFTMKSGWEGTRYIRSFKNIIGSSAIHHWILFQDSNPAEETVSVSTLPVHPDAQRLYGWAPGANDMYLDPDLGIKVEGGVSYTLEAHFNNTAGQPVPDASGVEVCVTSTPPKILAEQSWVGTDVINGTTATGNCRPTATEPIHIFASHPHMHQKGKHMKVVLNRAAGGSEVIHDDAFSFDFQKVYLYDDVVMQPGDSLTTTCTYSEPANFGTGTNDEMCYFFPVYWPAGALASGGLFAAIHGPNTCIDLF